MYMLGTSAEEDRPTEEKSTRALGKLNNAGTQSLASASKSQSFKQGHLVVHAAT